MRYLYLKNARVELWNLLVVIVCFLKKLFLWLQGQTDLEVDLIMEDTNIFGDVDDVVW